MALAIHVVKLLFLVSLAYSNVAYGIVPLQNPSFESPPTNIRTNASSQFVLLNTLSNVIPGWSFQGTVCITLQIESVAASSRSNSACWPIIDDLLLTGINYPRIYTGNNGFLNGGFEIGPSFLESSSQGILLEAEPNVDPLSPVQSALQTWAVLGTVKYIDYGHYATPKGLRAVELISGNPSGVEYYAMFTRRGQITLDFIIGDAGDSCVGDFTVVVQVETQRWNFSMRSNGLGSSKEYSLTFYASYSPTDVVPISFASYNEKRNSDNVLCGPVIDGLYTSNPSFETPPTNLKTNATSQFMLLDSEINVIPGWSFKVTVWYVTSGGNISLPGNGHGLQLGPNGMINQTFKSYDTYDCVLTFTVAPSSGECANNYTAVNVSASGASKVFFYDESLGTEMWQTYAFSVGWVEIKRGFFGVKIQSVVTTTSHSNVTCWLIVDALLVKAIGPQTWYSGNPILNSGFEVEPAFMGNSSQGVLLEAGSNTQPSIPLQGWTILGTLKYIDSKHFAVPEGRGAIELISRSPSGIATTGIHTKVNTVVNGTVNKHHNEGCEQSKQSNTG
ncbi:hypothetical protein CTI12_AA457510 [Artemisia annua]|uniref:DUF642 domain-containing protein n=1 Tax=Artemisia annua TaxID=35608 RepID=A0A2U1LL45_ARTAN|nr:hypothetical protein CTI12_AA457510 [Artemisia annua]